MKRREDPTSGYIYFFYLEKALFHRNINYRKNVTLSTAEAEFVSLTECTKQALWFKNLFKEIFNQEIKI